MLIVLAAHQGEELAIILPAVMLAGAFFIMRWANQSDKDDSDDGGPDLDRPVGLALPQTKTNDEVEARQKTSV